MAQNSFFKKYEIKSFSKPDEIREFALGRIELVNVIGGLIGRGTFQPGWRWSISVKPIAKTERCLSPHFYYQVSGVMRVKMDDGTEFDSKAGDVLQLAVGHDAWVVGDDPVVLIDFQGMDDYAKTK